MSGMNPSRVGQRMSHPSPSSGNLCCSMVPISVDANNVTVNSVGSSGASSFVTDANSGLSGGPQRQRSARIKTESYMRVPASPLSFSSNNTSISSSSVIDGPSAVHQSPNQEPNSQQVQSHLHQKASTTTSLPPTHPYVQESDKITHLQKKPRFDVKQEDIMQQHVLQKVLQMPDSVSMQNCNPHLQALINQQRLRQQQQQLLNSMQPLQRSYLMQQQQQHSLQLRHQFPQQNAHPVSNAKYPFDDGVCSRRLMQYLYHQRQRPADNCISYWRKFVAEYYSPHGKKRWCLSLYDNVGHHSLGVFSKAAVDAWQCDVCGSKSGRGFEATFEILPRLNEIKFNSGVIVELLFLGLPQETRFPNGIMLLEYGKAVLESVYEQLRVVRNGQLRVVFTPDLKILSWEFCARRHEELIPRRLVAAQVNQLLQVVQKCQSTIAVSGSDGITQKDLQMTNNMVATASRQVSKSLELQSLNDLGFSKRYVRGLQIAGVFNSMKDLMDFCRENKAGAIDGLKNFPRPAKLQGMKQIAGIQGLPSNRDTSNKQVAVHPGIYNTQINTTNQQSLNGSTVSAPNYQNLMTRQNSVCADFQHEAGPSFNNSLQNPSFQFQGSCGTLQGNSQNKRVPIKNGFPDTSHLVNHSLEQHAMHELMLHEMKPIVGEEEQKPSVSGNGCVVNGQKQVVFANGSGGGGINYLVPTTSDSFKAASQSDSCAGGDSGGDSQKAPDLLQNIHLSEEMLQELDGFFNEDDWKV